jgi:RNA polymerase sigma-70 factor (ECF subfamily)
VRAWQGLKRFRGDAALATWLTRIALNAALDHVRRRRTREVLHRALRSLQPAQRDPSQSLEDRDEVRQAIQRIPPVSRQVIALRYGLDLSIGEIAQVLGCPEGTIKSRLHAALARLQKIIRQERATLDGIPDVRGGEM